MSIRLSRVRWAMGQTLLPDHLRALEESALADSGTRFKLRGLPSYGLAKLQWNESLLGEGVLSLDSMALVLPSGLLLELKGNAQVAPLNLNIPGATLVSVVLHVRGLADGIGQPGTRPNCERDGVTCWLWQLELSTEQEHPDTIESFRLAEFEKMPDGPWRLASRYIPPLLCVGSQPFLQDELAALSQRLESYHYQLTQEIAAIYLSGADLVNAKLCLKSLINLQRFLANLSGQIHPHPFYLYEALKQFYIEICFYHNCAPQFAAEPYRHEQLATVFQEVLAPLTEQLQSGRPRSPFLPFTLADGLVRVNLPTDIREATEVYLLVQKAKVTQTVSLDGLKVAAVSRINTVHKFYLQGVGYKRLERPPFQHSFGAEVDIYQLSGGEEWDYALRELTVGFFNDPQWAEVKFFLYWRVV